MIKISGINIPANKCNPDFAKIISKKAKIPEKEIKSIKIIRKSLDARHKNDIKYVYTISCDIKNEEKFLKNKSFSNKFQKYDPYIYRIPKTKQNVLRPVIAGFGPAGMFCGLILAMSGLKPIILERGKQAEERENDIKIFFKYGKLNPESNVQFGEGGAGTFSDGKLNTGISDERIRFILEEFVRNGAPSDILIDAKPHIGTDILKDVVQNIRKKIVSFGGDIFFNAKLSGFKTKNGKISSIIYNCQNKEIELDCDKLVLATGHSARDTFKMLNKSGVLLSQKAFSVGMRCEHLQKNINKAMYGTNFEEYFPDLPPASYKQAVHFNNKRNLYTFCMCPGGEVIASTSELGGIVTNGMSRYARDGANANSALLCNILPTDLESEDPLAGIEFQRKIEQKAYACTGKNYKAPVIVLNDFLNHKNSTEFKSVFPTYKPGTEFVPPDEYLPEYVCEALRKGIPEIAKKIPDFDNPDVVLTGPESRSTSPVRINRTKNGECVSIEGIYPCGEGAGYAGGIMSAAVDGVKTAENIIKNI